VETTALGDKWVQRRATGHTEGLPAGKIWANPAAMVSALQHSNGTLSDEERPKIATALGRCRTCGSEYTVDLKAVGRGKVFMGDPIVHATCACGLRREVELVRFAG